MQWKLSVFILRFEKAAQGMIDGVVKTAHITNSRSLGVPMIKKLIIPAFSVIGSGGIIPRL